LLNRAATMFRAARPVRDERGITIIETTVILSVLFILAGVMSPIVSDSITTARSVKAKSDAEMIAMGLINLQKDLGADALAINGAAGTAEAPQFADVLATAGTPPQVDDREPGLADTVVSLFSKPGNNNGKSAGNGDASQTTVAQRRKWVEAPTDSLDDHLMTNRKGYRFRRPGEYSGWNGPYISAQLSGDPWGNEFLINSRYLDGGTTAADSQGRARHAVFVVSAGADGVIQTPFDQPIMDARAYGDDIVVRIQ